MLEHGSRLDRAITRAGDLALQVFMKALVIAAVLLLVALVVGAVV